MIPHLVVTSDIKYLMFYLKNCPNTTWQNSLHRNRWQFKTLNAYPKFLNLCSVKYGYLFAKYSRYVDHFHPDIIQGHG